MRLAVAVGLGLAACGGAPQPEGVIIDPDADVADLVFDGSTLYWESSVRGGIFALPVDPLAATPTTLVARDAALSAAAGSPTSIALADGTVYWTNINQATRAGGSVWSVPAAGGTPTVLVAGLDQPSGITVAGTSLYFIDDHKLYVTSTQGGSFVALASDVREFHVASGRGYWTTWTTSGLYALDLTTPQATPTMLAMPSYMQAFAVDDTNVYLRSSPDLNIVITELPLAGGESSTLFQARVDDGAFVPRLVLVGSELYFNARTQILRVATDGTGLERPVQNDVDITSLVVADHAIYFATTRNDVDTSFGPCACPVIVEVTD